MSHDALFVLRSGGREAFYYDRWAALQIDRLLLTGPEAVAEYITSLTPTNEPFLAAWLCGAVLLDLDRHELLYWANQFFGTGHLDRYYRALLRERWPGFTTRWPLRPLLDVSQALGRTPRELAEARERASLLPDQACADLFTRPWKEFCASYADRPHELAAWISERGEAEVRECAEMACDVWVTLRTADGTLLDQRAVGWMHESLLRAGPALVRLMHEAGPPRPDMLCPGFERGHRETLFIDEASRTVYWWQAVPAWMNPAGYCEPLWPGWTLVADPGGPRSHVERGGRSFAEIRSPPDEMHELLSAKLVHTREQSFAPKAWLAREAARMQAEHPDLHVHIETSATSEREVGRDAVHADTRASLAALIAEVDGLGP